MSLAPPPPPLLDLDPLSGKSPYYYASSTPPSPTQPSSPSKSNSMSPSILIILIILSVTFIASIFLCLFLRYLNRRFFFHLSATTTSSSSNSRISPEQQPQYTTRPDSTVSVSLIDSLPLFSFSSISGRSSSANAADCAICLSRFDRRDQLRLLPLCCHAFHAHCADTWLQYNQTCPLCRSPVFPSKSETLKNLMASSRSSGDSFRLEIGSISRRQQEVENSGEARRSYSIGPDVEYLVDEGSEVCLRNGNYQRSVSIKDEIVVSLTANQPENSASEVASGRSWFQEYADRFSNSLSFRSSGRFFSGSSRRIETAVAGDWDIEANRMGEEISELFRWFSGV